MVEELRIDLFSQPMTTKYRRFQSRFAKSIRISLESVEDIGNLEKEFYMGIRITGTGRYPSGTRNH